MEFTPAVVYVKVLTHRPDYGSSGQSAVAWCPAVRSVRAVRSEQSVFFSADCTCRIGRDPIGPLSADRSGSGGVSGHIIRSFLGTLGAVARVFWVARACWVVSIVSSVGLCLVLGGSLDVIGWLLGCFGWLLGCASWLLWCSGVLGYCSDFLCVCLVEKKKIK